MLHEPLPLDSSNVINKGQALYSEQADLDRLASNAFIPVVKVDSGRIIGCRHGRAWASFRVNEPRDVVAHHFAEWVL